MNKHIKLVLASVGFLLLIYIAVFSYNKLSPQNMPDNLLAAKASDSESNSSVPQSSDNNSSKTQDENQAENEVESETLPAMDFTVLDADGAEVSLHSLIGKPIVLNFWASWCSPCKQEFPDFQYAYDKYGSDVEFVMVNLTDGIQETQDKAQDFVDSNGYTLPVYYDINQEAAYTYYIYSIPTTFFIDADGNIIAYAQSMLDSENIEKGIGLIIE